MNGKNNQGRQIFSKSVIFILLRQDVLPELFLQLGHSDNINTVTFSPDGKLLISASDDHSIKIWDVKRKELLRTLNGHTAVVSSLIFHHATKSIFSSSFDGTIRQWNIELGENIWTGELPASVSSLTLSADELYLACGRLDGKITLYNTQTKEKLPYSLYAKQIYGSSGEISITDAKFNFQKAEGAQFKLVAVSSLLDKTGKLVGILQGWQWKGSDREELNFRNTSFKLTRNSLKELLNYRIPEKILDKLRGVQEQEFLKANVFLNSLKEQIGEESVFKYKNLLLKVASHEYTVSSVVWSPDGENIVSGNQEGYIRLWSWNANEKRYRSKKLLKGHEGSPVNTLTFDSKGRFFASGGDDGTVKLWDITTGTLVHTFKGHSDRVLSVAFSPDDKFIASGSRDGSIFLWETKHKNLIYKISGHKNTICSVTWDSVGELLAFGGEGSENQTLGIWDWKDGGLRDYTQNNVGKIFSIAPSKNFQKEFLYCSPDGDIRQWRKDFDYTEIFRKGPNKFLITSIAFAPDGKLAAYGYNNGRISLYEVSGADKSRWETEADQADQEDIIATEPKAITSIAFSPDSKTLATKSKKFGKQIDLWNVENGKRLKSLELSGVGEIRTLAFKDHETLASLHADQSVKFWKLKEDSVEFPDPFQDEMLANIRSIAIAPGGQFLAIGSEDSSISILDIQSKMLKRKMVLLPENEWIAYSPGKSIYQASPKGDQYAAIRFNNQLHAVYPLKWYRKILKQEKLALTTTSLLKLKQQELRLKLRNAYSLFYFWWKVEKRAIGVGVGVLLVIVICLIWTKRKELRPIEITKRFFTCAGFQIENITNELLLLSRPKKKAVGFVVLWFDKINQEKLINEIKSHAKKMTDGFKVYLVYKDGKLQCDSFRDELWNELHGKLIPISLSVLKRIASQGDEEQCTGLLEKEEESLSSDPYRQCAFQGRESFINSIRKIVERTKDQQHREAQHVWISGIEGIGKTYVVKHLERQLSKTSEETVVVYIDCKEKHNASENWYFRRILKKIYDTLKMYDRVKKLPKLPKKKIDEERFSIVYSKMFRRWHDAGYIKPFLLIIDHIEELASEISHGKKRKLYETLFDTFLAVIENDSQLDQLKLIIVGNVDTFNKFSNLHNTSLWEQFYEETLGGISKQEGGNILLQNGEAENISWAEGAFGLAFLYCGGHPLPLCNLASEACEEGQCKYVENKRVEDAVEIIQDGFSKNSIGKCYQNNWDSLTEAEQLLLYDICQRQDLEYSEEEVVSKEQKTEFEHLQQLGSLTKTNQSGNARISAKLFSTWIKENINLEEEDKS